MIRNCDALEIYALSSPQTCATATKEATNGCSSKRRWDSNGLACTLSFSSGKGFDLDSGCAV